jgi:histidinol-phosphate aminotransferase
MADRPVPRPRAEIGAFQPYRVPQISADVRIQANEWAEPNPASRYIRPDELDRILLNRYPSGADAALRRALAERWKVGPEQLVFGNGSNEVLLHAFLVFGGHGRTTVVFEPTYAMHARLARLAGGPVAAERIGLPYEVTMDRALAATERAGAAIVVFTTPNNPTGNLVPDEVILVVADRWPETIVLVDEAYSDFAGRTLLPEQASRPNLLISKTFSKVRAAAGLRLGVLIAHPALVGYFRAAQLPYSVNPITLAIAARIAQDDQEITRRTALATRERERVFAALRGVREIEVFPSLTNFILFRLPTEDVATTHARFVKQGVLIRDISSWPGCERCLRVSIGTPEENDRFIAALEVVFARGRVAVAGAE